MNLIEVVQRLHFTPQEREWAYGCASCDAQVEPLDRLGEWEGHADDCPWLALPRIVAALERMERLRERFKKLNEIRCEDWCFEEAKEAIEAALSEDVVPSSEHLTGTTR